MYSSMKTYSFKGLEVRTVMIDGECWFAVCDLCAGLGLSGKSRNANDVAKRALRGSELRREFIPTTFSRRGVKQSGERRMLLTNESGVYALMMRSNKPEAQDFRYWVTNEVLPSIRKTGSYTMPQAAVQSEDVVNPPALQKDIAEGLKVTVNLTLSGDMEQVKRLMEALLGQ